jgi:hypothetical protein
MHFHFPNTPEFAHILINSDLEIVVPMVCGDGCSILCEYNQLSRQKGYAVLLGFLCHSTYRESQNLMCMIIA